MAKYCPECGAGLAPQGKFCPECGSRIPEPVARPQMAPDETFAARAGDTPGPSAGPPAGAFGLQQRTTAGTGAGVELRDGGALVERIAAAKPGSEIRLDAGRYFIPDSAAEMLETGLAVFVVEGVDLCGSADGTTELMVPAGVILGLVGGARFHDMTLRLSDRAVVLDEGASLTRCHVVADETHRGSWQSAPGVWLPMVKVDEGSVVDCRLEGLWAGVYLAAPSDPARRAVAETLVQGCAISDCIDAGILVSDGKVVVRENNVTGCPGGIYVADGQASGSLVGNSCSSNGTGLRVGDSAVLIGLNALSENETNFEFTSDAASTWLLRGSPRHLTPPLLDPEGQPSGTVALALARSAAASEDTVFEEVLTELAADLGNGEAAARLVEVGRQNGKFPTADRDWLAELVEPAGSEMRAAKRPAEVVVLALNARGFLTPKLNAALMVTSERTLVRWEDASGWRNRPSVRTLEVPHGGVGRSGGLAGVQVWEPESFPKDDGQGWGRLQLVHSSGEEWTKKGLWFVFRSMGDLGEALSVWRAAFPDFKAVRLVEDERGTNSMNVARGVFLGNRVDDFLG